MIRILLCFLLIEVCFCSAGQKKFGEKGNYITTVVYVDLPSFSESTVVGDVFDHADNFNIQYNNVKFFKLSSAYTLGYRIDLTAHVVQLILRLGKAQIKGTYYVNTVSSSDTTSQDFELNLYADLIYNHEVSFQVDEKGEVSFGKAENPRLLSKKVKGKYTNPPNALVADLENYLNPNLMKAVVGKIYDEVIKKVNLNDVSFQIKNEIAFEHRRFVADRFKKAIADAFEDVHENLYNVFYFDRTNFRVQLLLNLGQAQIKGLHSVSNMSTQEFESNFYGHLIYSHRIHFVLVENGKVAFGKTDAHRLGYDKVKSKFSDAASVLSNVIIDYLNPKLLEAVVAKIYDEVRLKVSLDDVNSQIRSEIAFRYRTKLAARFEKAIVDAFSVAPGNALNIFYYDVTNFKQIFQNFEVTVPSYILRDVRKFHFENFQTLFVGVDVRGKARFVIPVALVVFEVMYRDLNKAAAENETFYAEYEFFSDIYEFEMIAKPDSATIEFGTLDIKVGGVQVSSSQGLYGDERDTIAQQLRGHLSAYFVENSYHSFSRYCKGLLAEGRITLEVFKSVDRRPFR